MWISRIQGKQKRWIDQHAYGSVIEKRGRNRDMRFYPRFLLLTQPQPVQPWVSRWERIAADILLSVICLCVGRLRSHFVDCLGVES